MIANEPSIQRASRERVLNMQRRAFNTCSLSFSFFSSPIVRVACRCARPSGTHGSERHAKQNETWRRRPTLNTQAATQPMVRLDIGDGRRFLAFFFLTNRYRRPTRGRPSGRKRRKRTKDNAEVGHSGHESAIRRHRRHVPLSTRKPTFPRFPLPRSPLSSRLWAHIHGRDSLQDTPPQKKRTLSPNPSSLCRSTREDGPISFNVATRLLSSLSNTTVRCKMEITSVL